MIQNHERFHTARGRRRVLIVDDGVIDRAILGNMLEQDYEVLTAADGAEGLALIRQWGLRLSAVLLDLHMPVMDGRSLLRELRADPELLRLPVIVLTAEKGAEIESLRMGASDFITKPFSDPEVVRTRVWRTIELAEDAYLIRTTEKDALTGLFNQEYFFRYAELFEQNHPEEEMDAVMVDICHFHLLNELHGRSAGDEVLRRLGERIQKAVGESEGLSGRRDADRFLVFVRHLENPEEFLNCLYEGLGEALSGSTQIRLRMGIWSKADRNVEMVRRFDRAKLAADTIRNNYNQSIAVYDGAMHEKELLAERLIGGVEEALRERQFRVWYQPKYAIQGERPKLVSAEALVRWKHPEFGMVSPGAFIPLFEENGLIQKLDHYVWQEAAEQMRRWREKFGITLPVSVNVSRIDIYDPHMVERLLGLVRDNGIAPRDYLLEITESAYTQDSRQLTGVVEKLREAGFRVEMDDFGSGYSSLNMLSELPVDALKLDMRFIRNLRTNAKNLQMMKLVVDIARFLQIPVIAEGVEKVAHLRQLREIGCDMVQGYYFSKPVPAEEFEKFIKKEERKKCSQ